MQLNPAACEPVAGASNTFDGRSYALPAKCRVEAFPTSLEGALALSNTRRPLPLAHSWPTDSPIRRCGVVRGSVAVLARSPSVVGALRVVGRSRREGNDVSRPRQTVHSLYLQVLVAPEIPLRGQDALVPKNPHDRQEVRA